VPLAAELSTALNRSVSGSGIGGLLDCLMSVSCPTVPSKGGLPPLAFTADLQRRTVDEAAHAIYAIYNDSRVAKFGAGLLIGELVVAMQRAIEEPAKGPRFLLHSGHDTGPMAPVLGALGLAPPEFPRFGDLIAVELYRTPGTSNHTVRLVHNGAVVTGRVPGCPDGEELCPFEHFSGTAAALTPTPQECGRSDEPAWWPRPATVP
jgi:hypothetical protein